MQETWNKIFFCNLLQCLECSATKHFNVEIREVNFILNGKAYVSTGIPSVFCFTDPLFPLNFLVNSWVPSMFDSVFQASFLCALLLFWLCAFHGIRQVCEKGLFFTRIFGKSAFLKTFFTQQEITDDKNMYFQTVFDEYIKHERLRKYLTTLPDAEKRVENMTWSRVFLMNFEVFGNVGKCCLLCLIHLVNRN